MVRRKYPPEFRARLFALEHVGRTPEVLPTEFESTAWLTLFGLRTGDRHDPQRAYND